MLDGAANARDLGGWPVTTPQGGGGTVRYGVVLRSAGLDGLTADGGAALAACGVRAVVDLRTAGEVRARPDALPPGVRHVAADVLADSPQAAAANVAQFFDDPGAFAAMLAGTGVATAFAETYRDIVRLPSARASYAALFGALAAGEGPVLFHCTTGKDRTGWGAAALLLLLGVSPEDVEADYLLTNERLLPALQPMFDAFAAKGGDPDLLTPVLGVRVEYLRAALDEMTTRFGDVEGYFTDGLGLGPGVQDALRRRLVEPAPQGV